MEKRDLSAFHFICRGFDMFIEIWFKSIMQVGFLQPF